MGVYLDYSATTPIKKEVLDSIMPYLVEQYGNPSSLYTKGIIAYNAIKDARKSVSKLINANMNEIYFTSGGSEADNWAIKGICSSLKEKGNHIITSNIEHKAILNTLKYMEKNGFKVTYVDVNNKGMVNPLDIEKAITDDTILISIMTINNEIGTIQPIKEIGRIAHKNNVLFHTDAVQAVGNIPIDVKDMNIDLLSMSSHKIYAPKGVGALYVREGIEIENLIHGGGQEKGMRCGTENVPFIVGFGTAAALAKKHLSYHIDNLTNLKEYLLNKIQSEIADYRINGSLEYRHPGNLNISFPNIDGEALAILLEAHDIQVSTASACSSKDGDISHVLKAIKVPQEYINGTIRISIGDFTTKEDIDFLVEKIKEAIKMLSALK